MDARVAAPLGMLVVAFVLPFAFAPAMFFAWGITLAALYLLSREPAWRRAGRAAVWTHAALLVVGSVGAGVVIGWRGRTLASGPDLPGAGGFANVLMVSGILATGILLLLGPSATSRRLARWSATSFAFLLAAMVLVATGERVAGLLGLLGAITLALVAAALVAALRSSASPSPDPEPSA